MIRSFFATAGLGLALAATASAAPIAVYQAIDTTTSLYTLHNSSFPIYVQKGKTVSSNFILRDIGTGEQVIISYGLVNRVKTFVVKLGTQGDFSTVEVKPYTQRIKTYTYPVNLTSGLMGTVQFEFQNVAPTSETALDKGATIVLRGVNKAYLLPKSEDEIEVPSTLTGVGNSWSIGTYLEDPANPKDYSGTMVSTSSISTAYTFSHSYTDYCNWSGAAPTGGESLEPGTLAYATAAVAKLLTIAKYQQASQAP